MFEQGFSGGFYYGGTSGNPLVTILALAITVLVLIISILGVILPFLLGGFAFVALVGAGLCYKYNKDRAEAVELNRTLSTELNNFGYDNGDIESCYEHDEIE